MNARCSKCGVHLSSPWHFCPQCGEAIHIEPNQRPTPAEHEKVPVKAGFSGLYFGLIMLPACLIVGTMLCMTGLGAFLGIPVIIAGILAPLLGPMLAVGELRGKCPWCGAALTDIVNSPSFDCHICRGKIDVQDRKFVKAA